MNIKSIALSALVAVSALVPASVEARPSRVDCGMLDGGYEVCHKPVGSRSIELVVVNEYNNTGFIAIRNCATGEVSWRANDGFTKQEIFDLTRATCNW